MDWQQDSRVIVHIADAPGHGRRLCMQERVESYEKRGYVYDAFPDNDADGRELKALLHDLRVRCQVLMPEAKRVHSCLNFDG